ncbi:MAG: caspase family protein [Candidatus Latescibacteria bacterium]|nr:caspase family protein [Candidatus Latescibacterota bacterium]
MMAWCLLLLALVAAPVWADKRALLIGVNDYTRGPAEWDLRGCENDVNMTRKLLIERYGFPEQNVKVLLNGDATAAEILRSIKEWLVKPVKPEDIVYFHFSGHGSQVKDFEGDEEDGYDEVICPTDMQQGQWASIITDDQLKYALDQIPARQVTIVLDACHSGTGTRDLSLSRPRFARFDPGPGSRSVALGTPTNTPAGSKNQTPAAVQKQWVTISGCRPDQTSADAWIRDGFYAGALTYHLVDNMRKAAPGTSIKVLMQQVSRDLQGASYSQVPQAEGDLDQSVLGVMPEPVRPPHALVERWTGNRVVLVGAGNLSEGSICAVFPPEDHILEGAGIGRLKVMSVKGDTAEGMVLDGPVPAPGYQVREILRSFSVAKLKLLIEAPDTAATAAFGAALAGIEFIEIAGAEERFDHRLVCRTGDTGWLGSLTVDGEAGSPGAGPDAAAVVEALRPQMENAYAVKFLAGLDNPTPPFKVSVWANRGREAAAEPQKLVQAKVGELLTFSFKTDRDCYLTLIDLGTTGKITVLFPNEYQPSGFVKAGQVYQTGTRGLLPFQIRASGPPGRELVKVIATLDSLALPSLKLGKAGAAGTRAIDAGSEFVRQLARDLSVESIEEPPPVAATTPADTSAAAPPGTPTIAAEKWGTDYLIVETAP